MELNENKETLKNYTKLWEETKEQLKQEMMVNQLNIVKIPWELSLN